MLNHFNNEIKITYCMCFEGKSKSRCNVMSEVPGNAVNHKAHISEKQTLTFRSPNLAATQRYKLNQRA